MHIITFIAVLFVALGMLYFGAKVFLHFRLLPLPSCFSASAYSSGTSSQSLRLVCSSRTSLSSQQCGL